ncbi:hypothetical protein F383_30100 [Gossypium arboreum]|uniref:Uncharacterized protein n=1 Tax=Gossypium arboreum TaxID=29729 RepID=A0A0B0PIX9_GOSAR|nr:hypothetical protein F383_30100 [Gossypium arboreum]
MTFEAGEIMSGGSREGGSGSSERGRDSNDGSRAEQKVR